MKNRNRRHREAPRSTEPDHSGRFHLSMNDTTKRHLKELLAVTKWNSSGVIRFALSTLRRILSGEYGCTTDGCLVRETKHLVNVTHIAAGEEPPFPAQHTEPTAPVAHVGGTTRKVAAAVKRQATKARPAKGAARARTRKPTRR